MIHLIRLMIHCIYCDVSSYMYIYRNKIKNWLNFFKISIYFFLKCIYIINNNLIYDNYYMQTVIINYNGYEQLILKKSIIDLNL